MSVVWVSKDRVAEVVASRVIETKVVLDVGSGIRPQKYFRPQVHICIEPYLPYLERLQSSVGDDPRCVFLNCTWDVAMKMLVSRSVDTVFALDFIEHLGRSDGLTFLQEAERVARRQIVVYTPLGFYPQTYDDPKKLDRWGMDGGLWQTHRSGWQVEDFGDGWELVCCKRYHLVDEDDQPLAAPFGAIWAFRDLDGIGKTSLNAAHQHTHKLWQYMVSKLKRILTLLNR